MLINAQKRQQLKANAHHLQPVVTIGAKGLTDNVILEIDGALTAHELIKVKIAGADKTLRVEMADKIAVAIRCLVVGHIGNIAILYRKKPNNTKK